SGQLLRPLQRPLFATVVHDQRMQISITGMKDVSDADAVLLAQAIDLTQRFPQTAARHNSVLNDKVRTEPPHGGERALTPRPDFQPIGCIPCDTMLVCPRLG